MSLNPDEKGPRLNISLTQKINLGDYQSAEVFARISDLPFDADEMTISIAQATMNESIQRMVATVRDNLRTIRRESQAKPKVETLTLVDDPEDFSERMHL